MYKYSAPTFKPERFKESEYEFAKFTPDESVIKIDRCVPVNWMMSHNVPASKYYCSTEAFTHTYSYVDHITFLLALLAYTQQTRIHSRGVVAAQGSAYSERHPQRGVVNFQA